ncbi:formate dehydrogenase accessory sulfurtransferase FdhD [Neobacillus cucumis]|uniref:formate dehydrogenase accessory sulfurtransferase FdhD n=1 Tax=Neobacillus cucumis TaxID=1740721 RepID=UPI002E1DE8F7|nr:formate dehydrogenase accessory sulfurtransferase FdhD [Neobacillus cucumis]MED4227500.1 formate dehydrogenase accessory sulfurtransferase FdhD [Neobacillus cucumis]
MEHQMQVTNKVLRYENEVFQLVDDVIVTEYPFTIILNDKEFATLICSPENIEELVVGFLASEGIIRHYEDIKELQVIETIGKAIVTTHRVNKLNEMFHYKRYVTSCCGKSRQSFYFYNDARTVKPIETKNKVLSIEDCFHLMEMMQKSSTIFQDTGGVHNAALCDQNGIIVARTDIGRHNALDKIYGYCLKHSILIEDKVVVFSGRISSEVLLKVAKIKCGIVLSKSAPTELALRLAIELGITTVGFIRNKALNIYTNPERIINWG